MAKKTIAPVDIFRFTSGIDYLKALLDFRCSQNLSYSLRAFAVQLGVSPTALSHLLNRKKKLTAPMGRTLLRGLNLKDKKDVRYLKALFAFEVAEEPEEKIRLQSQLAAMSPLWSKAKTLNESQTSVLDQWYYLATLELISIPPMQLTINNVAQRLGIEVHEVVEAIGVLETNGLVRRLIDDSIERTEKQFLIESQAPHSKLQNYHRQMLSLARKALTEQTNDKKFVGSETFSLSVEDLAEAKEIIETCFQQILALAQRSQNRTEVYHIGIQLFRLTSEFK